MKQPPRANVTSQPFKPFDQGEWKPNLLAMSKSLKALLPEVFTAETLGKAEGKRLGKQEKKDMLALESTVNNTIAVLEQLDRANEASRTEINKKKKEIKELKKKCDRAEGQLDEDRGDGPMELRMENDKLRHQLTAANIQVNTLMAQMESTDLMDKSPAQEVAQDVLDTNVLLRELSECRRQLKDVMADNEILKHNLSIMRADNETIRRQLTDVASGSTDDEEARRLTEDNDGSARGNSQVSNDNGQPVSQMRPSAGHTELANTK